MAHALWTGSINFGLVTIPVKLYTAVRGNDLHFNLLHAKDNGRINNVRVCSVCDKKLDWNELIKGYEVQKGEYVTLTDEDFKSVNVEATQSVDIVEFVDQEEIDPMLYDQPYYLEPEKKGRHAYALLRDALKKSGKIGIARVVIRTREHLAAVKPHRDALVLEVMHYADEIVAADNLELPPASEKTPPNEMKAALMLIDTMVDKFEAETFRDKYKDDVLAMIDMKAKGKPMPKGKAKAPEATNVVNLMDVLQRSLSERRKQRTGSDASSARSNGESRSHRSNGVGSSAGKRSRKKVAVA
ncbi:MAG: Ku protein [Candidatus Eremiobacter antarcticus]|nr:Ku protein [Candidatus Eremiobacteraeota bacterium]MBC5808986.1 Ku protein [Candidatus Eremiobacteraeota bacterium]